MVVVVESLNDVSECYDRLHEHVMTPDKRYDSHPHSAKHVEICSRLDMVYDRIDLACRIHDTHQFQIGKQPVGSVLGESAQP